MASSKLNRLASEAWQAQFEALKLDCAVTPSVPILYFGSLPEYLASSVRVVTVGLNPSKREFPQESPMSRFSRATKLAELEQGQHPSSFEEYFAALDSYFCVSPYSNWFNRAFGRILHGLDVSFYGNLPNRAIHTDICSPVATDPTWNKLDRSTQMQLFVTGSRLWRDLIDEIEPDCVLISVRKEYLDRLPLTLESDWRDAIEVKRKNPYFIRAANARLKSGKLCRLFFGTAAQVPFGTLSNVNREWAGEQIREKLMGD